MALRVVEVPVESRRIETRDVEAEEGDRVTTAVSPIRPVRAAVSRRTGEPRTRGEPLRQRRTVESWADEDVTGGEGGGADETTVADTKGISGMSREEESREELAIKSATSRCWRCNNEDN